MAGRGPPRNVLAAVGGVLGVSPARLRFDAVTGGCINEALRVRAPDGTGAFLKWRANAGARHFAAEADGLTALRKATTALRVPRVLGWSDDNPAAWLLLELVLPGEFSDDFWRALGEGLALLHEAPSTVFGWPSDNWIGSLPQTNGETDDWAGFWWRRRLEPQLGLAFSNGTLRPDDAPWADLEAAIQVTVADTPSRSSLLHGDLWSGNVYPDVGGRPVLIDPAVYRGHSEVDLAMTELFGGFDGRFYATYRTVRPVGPDYERVRRDIYQLYPLLVHVNLFGSAYRGAVLRAARAILSAATRR